MVLEIDAREVVCNELSQSLSYAFVPLIRNRFIKNELIK